MGMKIRLDYAALERLERAAARAAEQAMEAVKTDVTAAQVMPFDTGDMQNNQTFVAVEREAGGTTARLVTGSPQARRLYYHPEYNFQRGKNANAGGLWLADWIDGGRKDLAEEAFRHAFQKEAGL